jgi:hypothetical protein
MSELRERVANGIWDDRIIRREIVGMSWTQAKSLSQSGWKAIVESVYSDADAAIAAMQAEPTEVEPLLADMDALITTARQQRFGMDTHSPEYIGNCGFCEGVRAVRELIAARKAAS